MLFAEVKVTYSFLAEHSDQVMETWSTHSCFYLSIMQLFSHLIGRRDTEIWQLEFQCKEYSEWGVSGLYLSAINNEWMGLKYQLSHRWAVTYNLRTIISGCVWVMSSIDSFHSKKKKKMYKHLNAFSLGSAFLRSSLGRMEKSSTWKCVETWAHGQCQDILWEGHRVAAGYNHPWLVFYKFTFPFYVYLFSIQLFVSSLRLENHLL